PAETRDPEQGAIRAFGPWARARGHPRMLAGVGRRRGHRLSRFAVTAGSVDGELARRDRLALVGDVDPVAPGRRTRDRARLRQAGRRLAGACELAGPQEGAVRVDGLGGVLPSGNHGREIATDVD